MAPIKYTQAPRFGQLRAESPLLARHASVAPHSGALQPPMAHLTSTLSQSRLAWHPTRHHVHSTTLTPRLTRVVRSGRGRVVAMAVGGMAVEALKGAACEALTAPGVTLLGRVALFVTLLAVILREVLGTLTLAPYGAYALWVYSTLRVWKKKNHVQQGVAGVAIARNVRYGHSPRNLLDVYVPKSKEKEASLKPVVLFVHGGVWASGDKWQFSPLGAFLAEEGVVAVLAQYTLYPKVLAIDQVSEVSAALTWTMDNIGQYGGDPSRVFLMGHSSGAHLSAMVLWERACRRIENAQHPLPEALDIRIPVGYLGLAGVYNIGEHFQYEMNRGIGVISCMRPAMGWEPAFDSMSPSLLFESLLALSSVSFAPDNKDPDQIHVRGADLVPRCLFVVSHNDVTVPPDTSVAFHNMLSTLGCHSRVAVHDSLGHGDFVIWHEGWGRLIARVGPYLEDILSFIKADKK